MLFLRPGVDEWPIFFGLFEAKDIGEVIDSRFSQRDVRQHAISTPFVTVTACPPRMARSPLTRTRTTPPLADAWYATNESLCRCFRQYPARQQWADPVTGSSSIPAPGAKKRDTKSNSGRADRLVTIKPRIGRLASTRKFGASLRSVASASTSTR